MTLGTLSPRISATPRWSTPRTPDRPTDASWIAKTAPLFAGGALWPWQQQLLEVARERDTDGRLVYDLVVLVVGRRAGKSRLTHGIPTAEAMRVREPYLAASTAQNMTGATKRLAETWDAFRGAADPRLIDTSRMLTGVNHASIEWRYRRRVGKRWAHDPSVARLRVFPPTASAVRGDRYRFVSVDEALTLTAREGDALMEAIRPTLAEFDGHGQMWVLSNEGKDPGGWLAKLKEQGRAAVDAGHTSGICYVEYSISDDEDPSDPAVWRAHHPSLGFNLTEHALQRELDAMGEEAFAREYLNRESKHLSRHVLTLEDYQRVATSTPPPQPGPGFALTYDTTWDRSSSTVLAAWHHDTQLHLEIMDRRPGALWVDDYVYDVSNRRSTMVGCDSGSPAHAATRNLQHRGAHVDLMTTPDYAAACAELLSMIQAGRVTVTANEAFEHAMRSATRRPVGDRWVWDRRTDHDIAPLTAATVAVAMLNRKAPEPQIT